MFEYVCMQLGIYYSKFFDVLFCFHMLCSLLNVLAHHFWVKFSKSTLFSKLIRLLLKITEVTTEHQKLPKISTNSKKTFFLHEWQKKVSAKGQSPAQELEVSLHSRLYLLVIVTPTLHRTRQGSPY